MTQEFKIDPRNEDILISINGELTPRLRAMVSVFDSGFILGDGVWEGLRLHDGGIAFLSEHIERLYEGAKAIFMDIVFDERSNPSPRPEKIGPGKFVEIDDDAILAAFHLFDMRLRLHDHASTPRPVS